MTALSGAGVNQPLQVQGVNTKTHVIRVSVQVSIPLTHVIAVGVWVSISQLM